MKKEKEKKKTLCVNSYISGRLLPADTYLNMNSKVNFWDDL